MLALYEYCQREGIDYTIGLIPNPRLQTLAPSPYSKKLKRATRPKGARCQAFGRGGYYQADSWSRQRRVVYKAEAMEEGTNRRFVVRNRKEVPNKLYDCYALRGESENRIKDFKVALKADRLSCHRFFANQLRLLLHAKRLTGSVGHHAKEAGGGGGRAYAAGYAAPGAGEDRREGAAVIHVHQAASSYWPSRPAAMANPHRGGS